MSSRIIADAYFSSRIVNDTKEILVKHNGVWKWMNEKNVANISDFDLEQNPFISLLEGLA